MLQIFGLCLINLSLKYKFFEGNDLGRVSSMGLIPKSTPIFVSELCSQDDLKPKTVNSQMYAVMIKEKVGSAILGYIQMDRLYFMMMEQQSTERGSP